MDDGTRTRGDRDGWRENDGTPRTGPIEYVDRAGRSGVADGSSLSWPLIGHSDDVRRWRPARDATTGYRG